MMNGCILPDTPIVVDLWTRPDNNKVFFLTHLHADHTKNLTSSWRFPIYTSPANSLLLQMKFKFADNIVIPLELDEPHIILANAKGEDSFTVTLIDANHVPGAVMFFFQGHFGNILYCGDMRFYPEIFAHPILSPTFQMGELDRLYLDNTFAKENYNFPSRKQASEELFKIIDQHPNHNIKLGIRRLGKEDLLEEVAQKFQELILVDEEMFKQLRILRRPKVYTTDYTESRIHALSLNRIHEKRHQKWNEVSPTISILLTGLYYGITERNIPFHQAKGVFVVPYSDHSSWQELVEFIRGVKPRQIIPIVKDSGKMDPVSVALRGREDMSCFNAFMASSSSPDIQKVPSPRVKSRELFSRIDDFPNSSPTFLSSVTKAPSGEEKNVKNNKSLPFLNIEKVRKKKLRRRAISKGVRYTSFDQSMDDLRKDKEMSYASDNSIRENKSTQKRDSLKTNISPKYLSRQLSEDEEVDKKCIAETDVSSMDLPHPSPVQDETHLQQVPFVDLVASEAKTTDLSSSHAQTFSKSTSDNLVETDNSYLKALLKPITNEKVETLASHLNDSISDWKERQELLNKAIGEAKCLVHEMKKDPLYDTQRLLHEGFELCKSLESVRDSF